MKKLLIAAVLLLLGLTVGAKTALAVEAPYLNATLLGADSVKLWWSEVPGATYQVFYGPKDNPMAHGVTLGEGESYTVGQLFRNTSYVFTVRALRGNEVSTNSNSARVWVGKVGRAPLPAAPTPALAAGTQVGGRVVTPAVHYDPKLDTMRTDAPLNDPYISSGKPGVGYLNLRTSRGTRSGTITLHWNDPSEWNSGKFNIVYTDDPSMEKWGVLDVPRHLRDYTIGGLVPGKRYWFWMSTTNLGRTPWVSDVAR